MTILTIVFIVCIYFAALISRAFKLQDETTGALCMWMFLGVLCSMFYLMSLAH